MTDGELQLLRARAYGPEAVPLSAVELVRLQWLEQSARTPRPNTATNPSNKLQMAGPAGARENQLQPRPGFSRLSWVAAVLIVAAASGAGGYVLGSASSDSAARNTEHVATRTDDGIRLPGVSQACTVAVDARDGSVTGRECVSDTQR